MNKTIIKLIILIIIIIFISSYLVSSSGYYEYTMQERTILTSEKIKEFESDIKNNQDIDLKDYLEEDKIDYSNKFTSLVYNISNGSTKITRKIMIKIFKKIGSMMEE